MRIINVQEEKKSIAICYAQVEQPMCVYHSYQELMAYQQPNIQNGNFVLVNDFADYQRMINLLKIDLNYNPNIRYVNLVEPNIWIRTVDKVVPKSANIKGEITNELDANGKEIPTDGVFIRLYFILPTPTRHVLFTSSGVHTIGMTKWNMTGAIREWYTQEADARTRAGGNSYQTYIEKLSNKRRPDVNYIKIAFSIFHPMSPNFMDIDNSIKNVHGSRIKAADREKLIKSKAFKEAMISAIKILFPELVTAVRNEIPPEDMAKKLANIYKIAEDSNDIDKMLKVFQKIEDVGYSAQSDPISNMLGMGTGLSDPLIGDGKKKPEDIDKLSEIREKDNMPGSYIAKPVDEELLTTDDFTVNEEAAKEDKLDEEKDES